MGGESASSGARRERSGTRWFGVGSLVLAVLAARVLWGAHVEWERAEAALSAHDEDTAIVCFRRAASWYLPLNPYVPRALDELAEIARSASAHNDTARALVAERAIHVAVMNGRSLFMSHAERKARADQRIRELTDRAHKRAGTKARQDPSNFFSLLAVVGWLAWVGAALVLVTRGLDANSHLTERAARAWLFMLLGFLVFALGLAFA